LSAIGGVYPVGIQCLDLNTQLSCGFTQLDTVAVPPQYGSYAFIFGDGRVAANGNYYFVDHNGNLLCFSPTTGSCGLTNITSGALLYQIDSPASVTTWGSYVFVSYTTAAASDDFISCWNTATNAICPGYPLDSGPPIAFPSGNSDSLAPILSTT